MNSAGPFTLWLSARVCMCTVLCVFAACRGFIFLDLRGWKGGQGREARNIPLSVTLRRMHAHVHTQTQKWLKQMMEGWMLQKQIYSHPFLRTSCVFYSNLTIDPGLHKHQFLTYAYIHTQHTLLHTHCRSHTDSREAVWEVRFIPAHTRVFNSYLSCVMTGCLSGILLCAAE